MNIYDARWNAVKALFNDKIIPAFDMPGVDVVYIGERITKEQLIVADDYIAVKIDNCMYYVYNRDSECDEGAYDNIAKTSARIRYEFKLYSTIPF